MIPSFPTEANIDAPKTERIGGSNPLYQGPPTTKYDGGGSGGGRNNGGRNGSGTGSDPGSFGDARENSNRNETTTGTPNYSYTSQTTGPDFYPGANFTENAYSRYSPEQLVLINELEDCIAALDELIEKTRTIQGSEEKVAALVNERQIIEQQKTEVQNQDRIQPEIVTQLSQKAAEKSEVVQAYNELAKTTHKYEQPENTAALKVELKAELIKKVESLLIHLGAGADEAKSKASEITKAAENSKDKGLNLFQKITVEFHRLFRTKNTANWLRAYLAKNVSSLKDKPQAEVDAYIEAHYSDVYGDIEKQKAEAAAKKREDEEAAQIETRTKVETQPVAVTTETSVQPLKAIEPEKPVIPTTTERITNVTRKLDTGTALEMLSKSRTESNPVKNGQEAAAKFVEIALSQWDELDTITKAKAKARSIIDNLFSKNYVPDADEKEQIRENFDALEPLDTASEQEKENFKAEVAFERDSVLAVIDQRTRAIKDVETFYLGGLTSIGMSEEALANLEPSERAAKAEAIDRYMAKQYIGQLIRNQFQHGLIFENDVATKTQLINQLVDAGALKLVIANGDGGAPMPMLIAQDGQSGDRKFSAKEVVATIAGVSDYDMSQPGAQLAEAAFVSYANTTEAEPGKDDEIDMCGIIVAADPESWAVDETGKKVTDPEYKQEVLKQIVDHEWVHMLSKARDASLRKSVGSRLLRDTEKGYGSKFIQTLALQEAEQQGRFIDNAAILAEAQKSDPAIGDIANLAPEKLKEIKLRLLDPKEIEPWKNLLLAQVTREPIPEEQLERRKLLDAQIENNPRYKAVLEKRIELYRNILEGSSKTSEEYRANLRNYNTIMTFSQATGGEVYDVTQTQHSLVLGLNRITNQIHLGYETTDAAQQFDVIAQKQWIADYFVNMASDTGPATAYDALLKLKKAGSLSDDELKEAPAELQTLRKIMDANFAGWNQPSTKDEDVAKISDAFIKHAEALVASGKYDGAGISAFNITSFNELLKPLITQTDLDAHQIAELQSGLVQIVQEYMGGNYTGLENYLSILDYRSASIMALFLKPPVAETGEAGNSNEDATLKSVMSDNIHASPFLRHPARIALNNFYLGGRRKQDRMGEGYGGKLDIFTNYRHPKDIGNPLLQFGAFNHKLLMDGFGFGFKKGEIRMDSQDTGEAIAFAVGLPLHKFAPLERVINRGNVSNWIPKAYLYGNVEAYSTNVISTMYGRLSGDHLYDPQSMARLILEFGGFDYDASGQPIAKRKAYADRADEYRLNPELAKFIRRELASGPNDNRTDLKEIADSLETDTLYHKGKLVEVVMKDGNTVTKDTGEFVQKGGLTIGQISGNVLKEIKEIIVYWDNYDKSDPKNIPFNKWGRGMKLYLELFTGPVVGGSGGKTNMKIELLKKYEKMAEAMMVEDATRREASEGTKKYTVYELLNEMDRVQNRDFDDMTSDKTHLLNKKVDSDIYQKPKIKIGGKDHELFTAKEFMKEFSLSRAQKVLTTGVWATDYDYEYVKDAKTNKDKVKIYSDKEFVDYVQKAQEAGKDYSVDKSEDHEIHHIGDEMYLFIYPRHSGEHIEFKKLKSLNKLYDKDGKLTFTSKQTGFEFKLDAIKGLDPDKLKHYFGVKESFKVRTWNKPDNGDFYENALEEYDVVGRKDYDTGEGIVFDDVYDELTKAYQGKYWSFQYAIKLGEIDKYRDFSKLHSEFWQGIKMLDDSFRSIVVGLTILSLLAPGLGMLVSPGLLMYTMGWSMAASPFIARWQKGWSTRQSAAIDAQNEVISMKDAFWSLADDTHPPSFGQLDIAVSMFETVKYKYKTVCKSMNEGAKWNTNIFTNLLSEAYGKVSAKPW